MAGSENRCISLMVNRQERSISVGSIIYAQVTDKLCSIHLSDGDIVQIFLTLSSLKAMLPARLFVQINRSCLVSLSYFQGIDDSYIILTNGMRLPYSRRQKQLILQSVQELLAGRAERQNRARWQQNIPKEFQCFDHFPFAFCIAEAVFDGNEGISSYILVYANEAFASFAHKPLYNIMEKTFDDVFPYADEKWTEVLTRSALGDDQIDITLPHPREKKDVRVLCYQPHYGFCGCLVM